MCASDAASKATGRVTARMAEEPQPCRRNRRRQRRRSSSGSPRLWYRCHRSRPPRCTRQPHQPHQRRRHGSSRRAASVIAGGPSTLGFIMGAPGRGPLTLAASLAALANVQRARLTTPTASSAIWQATDILARCGCKAVGTRRRLRSERCVDWGTMCLWIVVKRRS